MRKIYQEFSEKERGRVSQIDGAWMIKGRSQKKKLDGEGERENERQKKRERKKDIEREREREEERLKKEREIKRKIVPETQ